MKPLWNGDRRDRVKWGGLIYLAQREGIAEIATILFARDDTPRKLASSHSDAVVELPEAVWHHFSSFDNLHDLGELAAVQIHVYDAPWQVPRAQYLAALVPWVRAVPSPKIIFLDPDTGLGSAKDGLDHLRPAELSELWNSVNQGDWLALYQHGSRNAVWRETKFMAFQACCLGGQSESFSAPQIANDVMLFASQRR